MAAATIAPAAMRAVAAQPDRLTAAFKPSPQAMRELNSLIGPDASRTH